MTLKGEEHGGEINGCKVGIIGPSDEEPEKDYEDCTASFGYPSPWWFPTIDHCVWFLRESYAGHQEEISAAALLNELIQTLYRPSTPSLD